LFTDWRIIVLPVANFPDEGVKEVKGLDDIPLYNFWNWNWKRLKPLQ